MGEALKNILLMQHQKTRVWSPSENCTCGHLLESHPKLATGSALFGACTTPGCHCNYWTRAELREELTFEVSLNLEGLENLARRAARNKQSRSTDGALTVKVTERRTL
jgi:hypothetical protein